MYHPLGREHASVVLFAAGPRQRSYSQVRVSRDSRLYFTVAASRLPQPGGPGPRNYIPKEQGGTANSWL
jgi:hypothetical protein